MAPVSQGDRTLRLINVFLWVPSVALLVAYGIAADEFILPLGNIPMSLSVVSTLVHLSPPSKNPSRGWASFGNGMSIFSDLVLASMLIGLLIPGWIICANNWDNKMLGAYAAVPMMIAFCIHSYFVLRSVGFSWLFPSRTCPHCQRDLVRRQPDMPRQQTMSQQRAISQYSTPVGSVMDAMAEREATAGLAREDYREPRASTDDENERLIPAQ